MDETGGGLTTVYTDSASLPHFGAIDGIRLIHHRRPTCEISITPAVRPDWLRQSCLRFASESNRAGPGSLLLGDSVRGISDSAEIRRPALALPTELL